MHANGQNMTVYLFIFLTPPIFFFQGSPSRITGMHVHFISYLLVRNWCGNYFLDNTSFIPHVVRPYYSGMLDSDWPVVTLQGILFLDKGIVF